MGTETWWFQKLFEFVFVVTIDITIEILRELFISLEYFCVQCAYTHFIIFRNFKYVLYRLIVVNSMDIEYREYNSVLLVFLRCTKCYEKRGRQLSSTS